MSRQRIRRLVPAGVLTLAMVGVTVIPSANASTNASAAGDPRSGAALNREVALDVGPAQSPTLDAPGFIGAQPVNDPSDDKSAQDTQSETSIAADGKNVVIAYNDSGSFIDGELHFTGYSTSKDGGKTFTDQGQLPDSTEGDAGDPTVAVDHTTGAFYMSTLGFNTGTNIQVYKSTNGGVTFGAPTNGTPGYAGSGSFQDKSWLTVDNYAGAGQSNLYLCWTKFGSNAEVRVTRSTNGGATFTPNLGVLIVGGSTQNQGCYVAVGPNHEVYVFYFQGSGDNKLFVRKSTDLGQTFAAAVQVTDLLTTSVNGDLNLNGGPRSNSFPQVAVNPVTGDLYVAFNDKADGTDPSDSYLVTSTNGGGSWSKRIQLNDEDGDRDQFFPTVAVSEAGTELMVGYYSRSHDPANFAYHHRSRLASISDGVTPVWQDSFETGPDNPIVIGQDPVINTEYMGDYDQIAATGKHFQTSWADNRYSNSFHANQPDVFAARIRTLPKTTNIGLTASAPASTPVGQAFTITVTVTNTGAKVAKDIYLSDVLPAALKLNSASVGGEACDVYRQLASCLVGKLGTGASMTMKVSVEGTAKGTFSDNDRGTTSSADATNSDDSASVSVKIT